MRTIVDVTTGEVVVYEEFELEPVEQAPPPVPDRVSRRQFGMQLIISGWRTAADSWVAQQDELTQWAYENSDTFVRDDPMLQAGFAALGVTEQQVDEFFAAAAAL